MNNEAIITVADVMTQEFIIIDGLATVHEALQALESICEVVTDDAEVAEVGPPWLTTMSGGRSPAGASAPGFFGG